MLAKTVQAGAVGSLLIGSMRANARAASRADLAIGVDANIDRQHRPTMAVKLAAQVLPPSVALLLAVPSMRGMSRNKVTAVGWCLKPDDEKSLVRKQRLAVFFADRAERRVTGDPNGTAEVPTLARTSDLDIILSTAGAGRETRLLQEDYVEPLGSKLLSQEVFLAFEGLGIVGAEPDRLARLADTFVNGLSRRETICRHIIWWFRV